MGFLKDLTEAISEIPKNTHDFLIELKVQIVYFCFRMYMFVTRSFFKRKDRPLTNLIRVR